MSSIEHEPAADLREHVGEDEDEQQRLHDRPGEGGDGVAPQHPEFARHHGAERPGQRRPRLRRVGDQGRDLGGGWRAGALRQLSRSGSRGGGHSR